MRPIIPLAALALTACTVGPTYVRPDVPVPPRFAEAPATTPLAAPDDEPGRWWTRFNDPVLTSLIERAIAGNLDLATAHSRIEGARAQEREARAARLPTLGGRAGGNRIDFSKNAGINSIASAFGGGGNTPPGQGIAGPGKGIMTWSIGVDASWEIDLFGGVRRGLESAQAQTAAAEWSVRDVQVSVVAEVAADYLMFRSLQSQIAIAQAEVMRQQATLRLVDARRKAGFITELPQRQQALVLSNVAASLPQLMARARDEIHALGVLTGVGADGLDATLATPAALPALPLAVPTGLPSDLLRRRPDIRAAERQLAAATADIGVAQADLYPKFNLMGMAELISTNLATLVARASIQTNANAAVTLPIFDGGRRKGVVAERRAAAAEALTLYQKAVFVAVQDVEDALADYTAEGARNAELRRGVANAERATHLARATFNAGLTDFQPVLDAEGAWLNSRNVLAQSDAMLLTDLARLYKALGGGWDT